MESYNPKLNIAVANNYTGDIVIVSVAFTAGTYFYLSELLPVTMVTMTSKCEFDRQNGILKDYLPRHSFYSQYGFSNR